uniref:Dual specificity protein phosphatase n=1 Tax=Ascaris lumbricoides TaxID=6252 RepID=A0A0M3INM0_ASCLU
MRYEGKSLREALEQINSVRRVSPNAGFMQQLLTYETALKEGRPQDLMNSIGMIYGDRYILMDMMVLQL